MLQSISPLVALSEDLEIAARLTKMTGHLSLADVQAKELGSLVLESAEFDQLVLIEVLAIWISTYGLWGRTPF